MLDFFGISRCVLQKFPGKKLRAHPQMNLDLKWNVKAVSGGPIPQPSIFLFSLAALIASAACSCNCSALFTTWIVHIAKPPNVSNLLLRWKPYEKKKLKKHLQKIINVSDVSEGFNDIVAVFKKAMSFAPPLPNLLHLGLIGTFQLTPLHGFRRQGGSRLPGRGRRLVQLMAPLAVGIPHLGGAAERFRPSRLAGGGGSGRGLWQRMGRRVMVF